MTVQTLIFSGMSVANAKAWAKRHGFRYGKVDVTSASVRLRQRDPREFAPNSFRTIPLRDGVQAVVGRPVAVRSSALRVNPERTRSVPELLMAVQDLVLWARGIGPATSRTRYYLRAAGYSKGGDREFWLGEALDEVKRDAQHDPRVASHVAYMLKEYPAARANPARSASPFRRSPYGGHVVTRDGVDWHVLPVKRGAPASYASTAHWQAAKGGSWQVVAVPAGSPIGRNSG
jgi:hypothetical protein